MRVTEDKLKNDIVECYTYYFGVARQFYSKPDKKLSRDEMYQLGKADGAVEALSAIMLEIFGGQQLYEIWQATLEWADAKEKEMLNDLD